MRYNIQLSAWQLFWQELISYTCPAVAPKTNHRVALTACINFKIYPGFFSLIGLIAAFFDAYTILDHPQYSKFSFY